MSITAEQKTEITNYVNAYRAIHQSPPIAYDDTIAEYSQGWATYLSENNVFYNSGSKVYGENLAYLQGAEVMPLLKKAVDSWYNEIGSYNFNGEFSPETAKLTCLLWKSSTQFGLGIGLSGDRVLIVFNTAPLGNYTNQMKQNVLAPILNLRIQPAQPAPQASIVATPKAREQPIPLKEAQAQAQAQAQPPPVPSQSKGPSKKDIVDGLYQVGNSLYSNKDKVSVTLVMNKIINALSVGMPEGDTKSALLKDLYGLNYAISTSKDMGSCFGTLSTIINQLKAAPAF
jgi:hypothetical protein